MSENQKSEVPPVLDNMVANFMLLRTRALQRLIDPRRDLDTECGYPKSLGASEYRALYDRDSIATRVVNIFPEETWSSNPYIYENNEQEETEFEKAWEELALEKNLYHYMKRVDVLSGIGHYGILLLGLDDGGELDTLAPGLDEAGQPTAITKKVKLNYVRSFDESMLHVATYQIDTSNPRYGLPFLYRVEFIDILLDEYGAQIETISIRMVHWSRVIHVADNRKSSDVFGSPRMECVLNRILDLRKTYGGSAEMFWKGGYPGFSFEVNPDLVAEVQIDEDALREQFERYENGLQRYLAVVGMQTKSLQPQIASPTNHVTIQLQAIAVALGIPLRTFLGAEEGKLASAQDLRIWNTRIQGRQSSYVTPLLIRPFIKRLMDLNVLPKVDKFIVEWSDLNAPTETEKASIAAQKTQALLQYVTGNVQSIVPPKEFLTVIMGFPLTVAEAIEDAIRSTPDWVTTPPITSKGPSDLGNGGKGKAGAGKQPGANLPPAIGDGRGIANPPIVPLSKGNK